MTEPMQDKEARARRRVAVGKARGIVNLWEVGAYTDAEAMTEAQPLLGPAALEEVQTLLEPMLREIRRRHGVL